MIAYVIAIIIEFASSFVATRLVAAHTNVCNSAFRVLTQVWALAAILTSVATLT
jgi:hypothetical protein